MGESISAIPLKYLHDHAPADCGSFAIFQAADLRQHILTLLLAQLVLQFVPPVQTTPWLLLLHAICLPLRQQCLRLDCRLLRVRDCRLCKAHT